MKNIAKYLKKLNNDLKKLHKYQDKVMYGLDYLFNKANEKDYYKPKEIKSAFDGSYILHESRGDKCNKLALYEYFHIIRLYLKEKKTEVKINKPIYLEQAVLDLSKTLMFEFWYDYLKPMYGDQIRLCYTDTDSFIMHIKT